MTDRRGSIKLGDNWYRIALPYKERDVIDFSPRTTPPGGGAIYSEMNLYQPLMQTDWRHGFGFQWHTDASGFLNSFGDLDTRQDGIVMLFTKSVSSDTDNHEKKGFVLFKGNTYSYGPHGVRKYLSSGGTWSDASPVAATEVRHLFSSGKYLYAAMDGLKIYRTNDGTTWAAVGGNAASIDYEWIMSYDGYIYAGKHDDPDFTYGLAPSGNQEYNVGSSNEVYRASTENLSDLFGDPDDDNNVIYVGLPGWQTRGAISFLGDMIVFKPDGIYKVDKDKKTARLTVDFRDQADETNFRSWAIHNNILIFPVRDVLYQWNGTRINIITPPKVTDSYPYVTYGQFNNFVTVGKFLFMTARTNETTYRECLLCFDGVGWHKLADLVTDGTQRVSALYFDPFMSIMFVHIVNGTTSNTTKTIQFQNKSDFPYASFDTTASPYIITSRFEAGYRRIIKSTPSILFEASNVDSGTYLKVYYSIDGGAWTAWGGSDGSSNVINENGLTELSDPLGSGSYSTLEYYYMQLKIVFVTDSVAESPILEGYTIRLLLRPDTYYGWSIMVVCATDAEFAGANYDDRTPAEILSDLETIRDSKAPVTFTDILGVDHKVYLTSVNSTVVEEHVDSSRGTNNLEANVLLNLVEVA